MSKGNLISVVTNSNGRRFGVAVVMDGETYGREHCLTHKGDPMVEFWDLTHPLNEIHGSGVHGQFVSRYYLSTLTGEDHGPRVGSRGGLCLDGGCSAWSLDRSAAATAVTGAEGYVALRQVKAETPASQRPNQHTATSSEILAWAETATREEILDWCLGCDPHGVYTDEASLIEYGEPLTRSDALECIREIVAQR